MTAATLAILAGGAGSRMGQPKAALRVGGKPILAYLRERLAWAGPTLLVTAPGRERPPGGESFDREVTDPTATEGPLRGVLTALEAAQTDLVVVTTCDMPGLAAHQLAWIAEELRRADAPLVLLSHGGRVEPFPLAIRATALPHVTDHFIRGGRSVHSLATLAGALVAPAPADWPADAWTNLNTPTDLAAFRDRLERDREDAP